MAHASVYEPALPGLFVPVQSDLPLNAPEPATEKQVAYAMAIAKRTGKELSQATLRDRRALSAWIDAHKVKPVEGRFSNYPSGKQVAFAERIARIKRQDVPRECFKDKQLMSRWIDGNKPR